MRQRRRTHSAPAGPRPDQTPQRAPRAAAGTSDVVDPRGWAKFDYVKMPEYRWGILLAPQEENRVIPFGENYGKPAWQQTTNFT